MHIKQLYIRCALSALCLIGLTACGDAVRPDTPMLDVVETAAGSAEPVPEAASQIEALVESAEFAAVTSQSFTGPDASEYDTTALQNDATETNIEETAPMSDEVSSSQVTTAVHGFAYSANNASAVFSAVGQTTSAESAVDVGLAPTTDDGNEATPDSGDADGVSFEIVSFTTHANAVPHVVSCLPGLGMDAVQIYVNPMNQQIVGFGQPRCRVLSPAWFLDQEPEVPYGLIGEYGELYLLTCPAPHSVIIGWRARRALQFGVPTPGGVVTKYTTELDEATIYWNDQQWQLLWGDIIGLEIQCLSLQGLFGLEDSAALATAAYPASPGFAIDDSILVGSAQCPAEAYVTDLGVAVSGEHHVENLYGDCRSTKE